MEGKVLDYSVQNNSGVISGADGSRYTFVGSEWKDDKTPSRGMAVDFDAEGTNAVGVYLAGAGAGSSANPGAKNKTAAGLFALFLGWFGIHKFYLGYTGAGLVMLLVNTIGMVFTIWLLLIPNYVLAIIAFIEGILYLTKSDEEFEQTYVVGKKSWF